MFGCNGRRTDASIALGNGRLLGERCYPSGVLLGVRAKNCARLARTRLRNPLAWAVLCCRECPQERDRKWCPLRRGLIALHQLTHTIPQAHLKHHTTTDFGDGGSMGYKGVGK